MIDCQQLFKDKRMTVMGLGLLGRGIGDVEFFAKCGADVLVTDLKSPEELAPSIEKLKAYPNIEFHLGEHSEDDFIDADLVIKGAKVPLDSPYILAAQAAGVSVAMSTALFAREALKEGAVLIGVTGTRGKTTVAQMIYHTLKNAGKDALLGGNIRGLSTLAMLPEVKKGQFIVLELDSWQLQGFGDMGMSPHIAVFTNLFPDHLDYYPDMESYFSDKADIFKYQKKDVDHLIVGGQVADKVLAASPPVTPVKPPEKRPWKLKVIGEHNEENAALAAAALKAAGLSDAEIASGLESFEAVEGRLQLVREYKGVKIYNDNNATTPEATIAGLRAIGGDVALITGGSEKNLELKELVETIRDSAASVILLTHPNYFGSERLAGELNNAKIAYERASDLKSALESALRAKKRTILFSPAFASFGMFKNEYERNDEFLALVRAL